MTTRPASGDCFVVIATGRRGVLLAPADDGHWKVILDELDDITEFVLTELEIRNRVVKNDEECASHGHSR